MRSSCSGSWRGSRPPATSRSAPTAASTAPPAKASGTSATWCDGKCPDHGLEPVWLEEENYYFLLSKYQDRLAEFFRAHPDFVKPRSRYNEALSFIEQGLDDISISRSSITWGVPVPWDHEQVIYVWVDALINYLSALTYARPGEDLVEHYWPPQLHVMAKDILKFHAVIWPALLMSAGYELPEAELIHGYLLMGGEKMSKTRGNVLDPFAVMEQYGIDPLRFYLMREVTLGQDGVISLEGFEGRYNSELANELGNLVSRSVSMIGKYRDGRIPSAPADEVLREVAAEGEAMVRAAGAHYDAVAVTAAIETVWEYVRRLNRLVEEEAPWKLAKDEAQAGRLDMVLHGLAAGLRLVALGHLPGDPGHGRRDPAPSRPGARRRRPAAREARRGPASRPPRWSWARRCSRASRPAPEAIGPCLRSHADHRLSP